MDRDSSKASVPTYWLSTDFFSAMLSIAVRMPPLMMITTGTVSYTHLTLPTKA